MAHVDTAGQPEQTSIHSDTDADRDNCLSVVASNAGNPTATIVTPVSPVPIAVRPPSGIPTSSPLPQHHLDESESLQNSPTRLDFIATSRSVKNLFSLPYSADRPLHVAVHNLNGTLLIDTDDEDDKHIHNNEETWMDEGRRHGSRGELDDNSIETIRHEQGQSGPLSEPSSSQSLALALTSSFSDVSPSSPVKESTQMPHNSEALTILSQMINQVRQEQQAARQHDSAMVFDASASTSSSSSPNLPPKPPLQYVEWAFHDMNLLVGSDALVATTPASDSTSSSSTTAVAIRVEDVSDMKLLLERHLERIRGGQFVPDHQLTKLQQQGKPSYADALRIKEKEQVEDINEGSFSAPNLDRVRLQTCIVPTSGPLGGLLSEGPLSSKPSTNMSDPASNKSPASTSAPVRIVLDAYLDNVIANVPQLALCLRDKGFIQSVKLLQTKEIPSMMLQESTLDTSLPFEHVLKKTKQQTEEPTEEMFSPEIMEMNASALLRFLQTNCSRDNATYLLRREVGDTNIQLYDISSISRQRQRKWSWWLATMSYRFAQRLRHLEFNLSVASNNKENGDESTRTTGYASSMSSLRRQFRDRQRSLLQTTLDLLEDLADLDGQSQESLVAAVNEHMADTFLGSQSLGQGGLDQEKKKDEQLGGTTNNAFQAHYQPMEVMKKGTTSIPSAQSVLEQPYSDIPVDGLNKAQDHLINGIKRLRPVLEKNILEARQRQEERNRRRRRRPRPTHTRQQQKHVRVTTAKEGATSSSGSDEDHCYDSDRKIADKVRHSLELSYLPSEAIILQLIGLHSKLIDVSLRLAEHHLRNYWSSSAMQALRTSARRIADSGSLLHLLSQVSRANSKEIASSSLISEKLLQRLQLQYTWLWEHCGHFARSFASDELWRDRGHACGDDVISVLRDVEAAFAAKDPTLCISTTDDRSCDDDKENCEFAWYRFCNAVDPLSAKTDGLVSLHSLAAVVDPQIATSAMAGTTSSSRYKESVYLPSDDSSTDSVLAASMILGRQRQIQRDKRQVLVASSVAYGRAIRAFEALLPDGEENPCTSDLADRNEPPILRLLRQRLGDSFNETGKVLLDALRSLLSSPPKLPDITDPQTIPLAAEGLLSSAQFWFLEGLDTFEICQDLRNLALLRCNLCQCFKLRANSSFATTDNTPSDRSTHAEFCLEEAAMQLQAAHEALGQRDVDPMTWDMVSEELASAFLVLGVRRRQSLIGGGNTPILSPALRLPPGKERSIVDPMERALRIYDELGNAHQAAAVHYQLALTNSKVWTCQRDEAKTREKLSAAFQHYNMAFAYFSGSLKGNEPTFVLLCLDLASLYAAVSGEECLTKALVRCLDSSDAFSQATVDFNLAQNSKARGTEWLSKMGTLASSVEDRVFKLLRSLVKLESSAAGTKYKELYRVGLSAKMAHTASAGEADNYDSNARQLLALHDVLVALRGQLG